VRPASTLTDQLFKIGLGKARALVAAATIAAGPFTLLFAPMPIGVAVACAAIGAAAGFLCLPDVLLLSILGFALLIFGPGQLRTE